MKMGTKIGLFTASLLTIAAVAVWGAKLDAQSGNSFSGPVYFKKAKATFDSGSALVLASGSTFTNASTMTNSGTNGWTGANTVSGSGSLTMATGTSLTLNSGSTIAFNGTVTGLDNADLTNRTRYVDLSSDQFVLETDGSKPLAAATVPITKKVNNVSVLQWAQGDTAKVQATFRVPADYVSGFTFVCMFHLEAASADTTVDFEVWVNRTGAAFDAATTNQTPVAVSNNTANNQDITLTVATDTIQADDVVTFAVWRAAGTGAGSYLDLHDCRFAYTADM